MFAWIGGISNLFGYVLNFIYNIVGNYGVAMIIFTIIAKLLLSPFAYFQQKNSKKTTLINEEVQKIQKKYKGNDKKIQEETMRVYKENNASPFTSCSSCFTIIIQMIIMIAMIYLVSEPLTYMRKMDKEVYRQYEIRLYEEVIAEKEKKLEKNKTEEEKEENKKQEKESEKQKEENKKQEKESEKQKEEVNEDKTEEQLAEEKYLELKRKAAILRPQMQMISRFKEENKDFDINMEFLGLDLTKIPTESIKEFNLKEKETYISLVNLIIPALYILTSILSIIYTSKQTKKAEKEKKQNEDVIEVKVEKTEKEEKSLEKQDDNKLDSEDVTEAMQGASKMMVFFMPIMMFVIVMNQPQSLALYWFIGNIYTFIEKFIVTKIVEIKEKKEEVKLETIPAVKVKEKKKNKKK